MKYYITTDTHLGHKKIIEYENRPVNFEERILKNIVDVITIDDVLIHLGDICIGGDRENNEKLLKYLNCKKWLVKGNHDKKSTNWYLNAGWDFVCDEFCLTAFGKRILFTHCPKLNLEDYDLNIHGHLHSKDFLERQAKHRKISIEESGYRLINLEKIIN